METEFLHAKFWNYHLKICDNGQITIGTIIHLHHVIPIDNIMPDNCTSIFIKKPFIVMREQKNLSEVLIKETVPADFSTMFFLNYCRITIHYSNPQESGCVG